MARFRGMSLQTLCLEIILTIESSVIEKVGVLAKYQVGTVGHLKAR